MDIPDIEKAPKMAHPEGTSEAAPSFAAEKTVLDKDADLAGITLQGLGVFEYTPAEERAVVWKLDLRLMPMMALTFGE